MSSVSLPWNLTKPGRSELLCLSGCALGLAGLYAWRHYYSSKHATKNVYESERMVNEYLLMHYGTDMVLCQWSFGPKDALNFPRRCVEVCNNFTKELRATGLPVSLLVTRYCLFHVCSIVGQSISVQSKGF